MKTRRLSSAAQAALNQLPWERTPERRAPIMPPGAWRRWHFATFQGSPIPVRLAPWEPLSHRRLYLGPSFYDRADAARPDVDAIVNLCECQERWELAQHDVHWRRGEGVFGYGWAELEQDATTVAEWLRADRTVLIHCMAGVNRSPTLTCATLMVLEGLDARAALARVMRFHLPAHPEDRHWLVLRQLEIALADHAQSDQRPPLKRLSTVLALPRRQEEHL